MKIANYIIAGLLIAINAIIFVPFSYKMIETGGGSMGIGILLLFITIPVNLFLIPAMMVFLKKYCASKRLLIINTLGLLISIILELSLHFFQVIYR